MVSDSFIKPYLSCSLYLFCFSYNYFTLSSARTDYKDQFCEIVSADKGYGLCSTPISYLKGIPDALEQAV